MLATIELKRELTGKILDIGGGGDGIIGRLYLQQVTAIDNRQDELDEAPGGFVKMLMDATELKYENASFDDVTFFFALMFMRAEEQQKAIFEAARCLKSGGELFIWDCDITSAYPEPFCVDVEVYLPDECVSTTYGVCKLDTQNCASISKMCANAGLILVSQKRESNHFYLKFKKQPMDKG